jgi:D-alanyl-D-alanine carboxypeptidase (penicillin-binding protein 5/6)
MDIPPQMIAPLEPHANAGQIRVALDGEVLAERPLLTLSAVEPGSLWRRMVDTVELWFE